MNLGEILGPVKAMGTDCWAARHRDLVPINAHHVWPKGHGGPDVPQNRINLCANHHYAAHDLLAKMLRAGTTEVPWKVRRRYGHRVRRIAVAGFTAIKTGRIVAP